MNNFDSENSVSPISDAHTAKSLVRDLNMVVKELHDIQAFQCTTKKVHTSFKTMSTNLIRTLDGGTVKKWMVENMAKLLYD